MVWAGKWRARRSTAAGLKLLTALLLAAGAYWVVLQQQLGRINLPTIEPAAETLPAPPPPLPELSSFDGGLGIGLCIGARWDVVAASTAHWGIRWRPAPTGIGMERVQAPGVAVGLQDGRVRSYNIGLAELGAAEVWKQWAAQLRAAGLTPELSSEKYTGQAPSGREEHWLSSPQRIRLGTEELHPAYCLVFVEGKLSELRGAVALPGSG